MKTFIKKVMVVLVVLAAVVDWPVKVNAGKGEAAVKVTKSLLESCAKGSRSAEREVNKATQEMERLVNEAAENPNVQRGVIIGGSRLNNAIRSNAQTTSQPHWETCPGCQGDGKRMGADGIIYVHTQCNGTGKIYVK